MDLLFLLGIFLLCCTPIQMSKFTIALLFNMLLGITDESCYKAGKLDCIESIDCIRVFRIHLLQL